LRFRIPDKTLNFGGLMEQKVVECDGALFSALKDSKTVFDLVELSGKVRKDVWILSY